MKILILGTSGRLGNSLYHALNTNNRVFHTGLKKRKIDFNKLKKLEKLIIATKPEIIINCVSKSNIDYCEKFKKKSNLINVGIIKKIVNIKKNFNMKFKLVHFSTDHMYDISNKKNKENSKNKINNHYTKQKIESEKIAIDNDAIVFRINFFGFSNSKYQTFTDWLFTKFKKGEKLTLFNDVHFNPISLRTLSKIISKLIKNKSFFLTKGIYNLGSKNCITKKNFAIKFLSKQNFEYSSVNVNSVCKVKRSKYMQMNVNKFERKFNFKMPYVEKEIMKEKQLYEKN